MCEILGIILAVFLCSATLSVYSIPFLSPVTLFAIVGCVICWRIFVYAKTKRDMGTILVFLLFLFLCFLTRIMLARGYAQSGMPFGQWMLTAGDEALDSSIFIIVLLMWSVFFFTASCYYFSGVLYRSLWLFVTSLLPMVLHAKVMAEINNFYLVIICTLNIIIAIVVNYYKTQPVIHFLDSYEKRIAMVASSCAFIFILLMASAAIPKPEKAKYYDRFEELFLRSGEPSESEIALGELSEISGNADNYKYDSTSAKRLFILMGPSNAYMGRQSFERYNYEKNYWYKDADVAIDSTKGVGVRDLKRAIEEAAGLSEGFAQKYGVEDFINSEAIEDSMKFFVVYPQSIHPVYFLHPARLVQMEGSADASSAYTVRFFDEFSARIQFSKSFPGDMSDEQYESMLLEMIGMFEIVKEENYNRSVTETALEQFYMADTYKKQVYEKVPEKIHRLAVDLTKDCKTDYEKADALQKYFHNGDFSYDLEYRAPVKGPEYFLFESKTGTCSDFATAYTLMARSIGLTVVYQEGFVPEKSSRKNFYFIKESDSHAYPLVYIKGMGFMVFEPTVSTEKREDVIDQLTQRLMDGVSVDFGLLYILGGIAALLVILGGFFRLISVPVLYIFFELRILFLPKHKKAVKIYKRYIEHNSHRYKVDLSCMTPREVKKLMEDRGKKRLYGRKISKFFNLLEKALYDSEDKL